MGYYDNTVSIKDFKVVLSLDKSYKVSTWANTMNNVTLVKCKGNILTFSDFDGIYEIPCFYIEDIVAV